MESARTEKPVIHCWDAGDFDGEKYYKRDIIHLAGISESTYQKLVNNEPVRMDVLGRLCDALNVDVGDICSLRHR